MVEAAPETRGLLIKPDVWSNNLRLVLGASRGPTASELNLVILACIPVRRRAERIHQQRDTCVKIRKSHFFVSICCVFNGNGSLL